MPGTHFARWVILEDVVYQGGRQRRDNLKASRLLFTSNFDGPLDAYLEALRTELADDADAVWGHCAGYPGRADAPAFAAYFRNHQVESALFFGAYGDQTVAEVHANLARRTRLIEFAMAAQGLDAGRAAGALPGGVHVVTEALELASIQGFVVRGYRLPSAGYLFLRIDDAARARALLAETTPDVLTADPWETKPESGINIAFTYAGLEALGVPGTSLAGFPDEFRSGMAARAELLGDVGESAPEHWEAPFGRGEIHVLVMISAQDPAALAARDAMLREAIERHGGITVVGGQSGSALPGGTEHFGFADGFAQPSIEGSGVDPLPGQGAPLKDGGWRPIRAGEFILGYRDEENAIPRGAGARPARRQRLLPRLPQAAPGRGARSAARSPTPRATTRAARSSSRPSSSGAGATARRSTSPPTAPTPRSSPTPRATTRSPTSTTRTGCAAPPAATSAAPTRATACRSRASSSTATA